MSDAIEQANALLRERGYAERDLAVHTGPRGKALLKGNKILSPLSDEAEVVLRVVRELVPADTELGVKAAPFRSEKQTNCDVPTSLTNRISVQCPYRRVLWLRSELSR